MPEKCLIPCAIDEEIRIDIDNVVLGHRTFLFNFPVRICTVGEPQKWDAWIDDSGSLLPETTEELERLSIAYGLNPIKNDNERWVLWARESALRGHSSVIFINESTPYGKGDPELYDDLAKFGMATNAFPEPIHIKLVIIADDVSSPWLIVSAKLAFSSGVFDKVSTSKKIIDNPDSYIFNEIMKEKYYFIEIKRINGWARKYIDFLRKIAPLNPLYNLLDEGLFDIKIFSYESTKKIEVSIKCGDGNNCPDGYCEIPSNEYPFYCCVKF